MNSLNFIKRSVSLPILLVAALFAGCGESDSVVIVKKSPAERPDVDKAIATKGALSLPSAQPFNYVSYTSGQVGESRGESAADGGSAWGEFQVGYCFDNMTGGPLNGSAHLRFKQNTKQSAKAPLEDAKGNKTTSKSQLRFLIKDSVGMTLKTEQLGDYSLDKGPQTGANSIDMVFDARFESERGYYLVLLGRTDTQAVKTSGVESSIDIEGLSLEITWRPAEPASVQPVKAQSAG
jgi:hypothetical protein